MEKYSLPDLSYLHGKPVSNGLLRSKESDFKVFEIMPFSPTGEGEHLYIHIEKIGANTVYVARELAKYFGVKESLVSYAGLKDRFAVTQQWFAVHVPGKQVFDLSDVEIDGVKILSYARHNKKLRTGALLGNRFEITLKSVSNVDALKKRWQEIVEKGVPNYFGEQRFGIDGGNLARALALFEGQKVKDKKKRSIYLSAARSFLFNHIIDKRIKNEQFSLLQTGDVCMLAGTQSVFKVEDVDETLAKRLNEFDIDITAPMWGAGELMSNNNVEALESQLLTDFPEYCKGLGKFGLKQERRKIRLILDGSKIDSDGDTVVVSFNLPAGSYATTVLRELLNYQDMTQRIRVESESAIKTK